MDVALAGLGPGSALDLRGTTITTNLLERLLRALTPNEEDAHPVLGHTWFNGAQFTGDARFDGARFTEDVRFDGAQFNGDARFDGAQFTGDARFDGAQFNGDARFNGAQFTGHAGFDGARFTGDARFDGAQFNGDARFDEAQFTGHAGFDEAQFTGDAGFDGAQFTRAARFNRTQFNGDAWFSRAQFTRAAWFSWAQFRTAGFNRAQFTQNASFDEAQFTGNTSFRGAQFIGTAGFNRARFTENARFDDAQFTKDAEFDGAQFERSWCGPVVCRGRLSASGITMARAVRMQVAAAEVYLVGARFAAPAVFSVRYGAVDLTDVAAEAPVTIASHPTRFTGSGGREMDESAFSGDTRAKVTSLAGVDAANVVLSDVDLFGCVFSGAHHLDQIRLEGRCLFAATPRGWSRIHSIPVRRWTRRKVLAEEAAWRALPQRGTLARAGWTNPGTKEPIPAPAPAQLAVLYRQLRKALEDGKDTPGAADFYYGEMEARRHDTESTARGERALLHAYWLLSGYALRASRALGFLAATAATTFVLLLTVGLPDNQLDPQITGSLPAPGGHVVLTQATPEPALTLPFAQRFTTPRADQAALVVVNSVIFRSTDTTLTGPGTWIEIISRIGEPVLLGFAAVAARGRVQR